MQTAHIPPNWTIYERKDGIEVFDEKGVRRCGGKKRNSGQPCRKYPVKGRYRCADHNGNVAIGEAHHRYKHGERSRIKNYIPSRLRSRFQDLLDSGEVQDLSEYKALLDLRLTELAERIDVGEFGAGYNRLRSLHKQAERDMNAAFRKQDKEALQRFVEAFNQMGEIIGDGQRDYNTWQQIIQVTDEQRKLAKTASDIQFRGENAISVTHLFVLVEAMADLFKRVNRLEDEDERKKEFALGIDKLIELKD